MEALRRLIETIRGNALVNAIRLAPEGAGNGEIQRLHEGLLRGPRDPQPLGRRVYERLPWPRVDPVDGTPLGLDLKEHRAEIEAAIATVPHRIGTRADFETAVWIALGDRNQLPSAFDPRRGWSVRGYVAKVCYATRTKLRREYQRDRRRKARETPYVEL